MSEGGTVSGGWAEDNNKFDKYEFKLFGHSDVKGKETLFVGKPSDFPKITAPLQIVRYLNGTDAVWIAEGE